MNRFLARYGSAIVAGVSVGWLAPGILSLPFGALAAAGAYRAAQAVTPGD